MCTLTTVTFWRMLFFPSPNFLRGELLLVIVKPLAPLHKESIFVTLIWPRLNPLKPQKVHQYNEKQTTFQIFQCPISHLYIIPAKTKSFAWNMHLFPLTCFFLFFFSVMCFPFNTKSVRVTDSIIKFLAHWTGKIVSQTVWGRNVFFIPIYFCVYGVIWYLEHAGKSTWKHHLMPQKLATEMVPGRGEAVPPNPTPTPGFSPRAVSSLY